MAISIIGLQGARQSTRDAQRKNDLQTIRQALEFYRSDCGKYPNGTTLPNPLVAIPASCGGSSATYLSPIPVDPISSSRYYKYDGGGTGVSYTLCASLEVTSATVTGCTGSCGGSGCNVKYTNP